MARMRIPIVNCHIEVEKRPNVLDAALSKTAIDAPMFSFVHEFVSRRNGLPDKFIHLNVVEFGGLRFLLNQSLPFLADETRQQIVNPQRVSIAVRQQSLKYGPWNFLRPAEVFN